MEIALLFCVVAGAFIDSVLTVPPPMPGLPTRPPTSNIIQPSVLSASPPPPGSTSVSFQCFWPWVATTQPHTVQICLLCRTRSILNSFLRRKKPLKTMLQQHVEAKESFIGDIFIFLGVFSKYSLLSFYHRREMLLNTFNTTLMSVIATQYFRPS